MSCIEQILQFKVAYYTFFSNNSVRDARAKQAKQDLSRMQNSRERDKENPEIKQYENLRIKFAIILGFLKK